MIQTTNDQSLPFWVTVRRNDGKPKFYSGAATLADAEAIAADRNAKEVELRNVRAGQRAQPVDQCDLYVYAVVTNGGIFIPEDQPKEPPRLPDNPSVDELILFYKLTGNKEAIRKLIDELEEQEYR